MDTNIGYYFEDKYKLDDLARVMTTVQDQDNKGGTIVKAEDWEYLTRGVTDPNPQLGIGSHLRYGITITRNSLANVLDRDPETKTLINRTKIKQFDVVMPDGMELVVTQKVEDDGKHPFLIQVRKDTSNGTSQIIKALENFPQIEIPTSAKDPVAAAQQALVDYHQALNSGNDNKNGIFNPGMSLERHAKVYGENGDSYLLEPEKKNDPKPIQLNYAIAPYPYNLYVTQETRRMAAYNADEDNKKLMMGALYLMGAGKDITTSSLAVVATGRNDTKAIFRNLEVLKENGFINEMARRNGSEEKILRIAYVPTGMADYYNSNVTELVGITDKAKNDYRGLNT